MISITETSTKGGIIIQTNPPPPSVATTDRNLCLSLGGTIQRCGSITLTHSLFLSTMMNRFFSNKRKKSPEPFPRGTLPTTPTDIAAEPVRYQVRLNIGPGGGQARFYQCPEVDRPDLTVALDDMTGGRSRIGFQDSMAQDQVPPASVASTSAVVISGTGRRNNRTCASDPCH